MPEFNLGREARQFASHLQDVLNGTVCHGITLSAVGAAGPGVFKVGYNLRSDDYRVWPIPLTIGAKHPSGYFGISYSLRADDEGEHLMVQSSVLAYSHDEDLENPLLHYDYERGKEYDYADSHLQVCAHSDAWDVICERRGLSKELGSLHLPLGGRRFRPTVENVIGLLIAERLADHRDTWRDALREGQERFDDVQVAAAVRRNPEAARRELSKIDRALLAQATEKAGKERKGRHRA